MASRVAPKVRRRSSRLAARVTESFLSVAAGSDEEEPGLWRQV